ncbi:DUF3515 domain-containing protein [Nocardioides sp.]|uniref:DUF3515 domain-containing protein n=1 Tax=Nocardioides sp. TaxID=35761 RepID=UPI002BC09C7A|nr:DUF3515 domain-containing protein [Nocardioides sp.]HSX66402.1 DUF3515 domain-containing protein [Nocardioides sp.]
MPRLTPLLPLLGLTVLLAACSSGDVEISSGDVTPAERAACEKLLDTVPAELDGLTAREVTPATALGRAWGDPAVVLSCGVAMPEGFQPGASCEEVNGVGWYVPTDQFSDLGQDLTVYTIGREPVVELVVPSEQRRDAAFAADALATLADPVKRAIPETEPCI